MKIKLPTAIEKQRACRWFFNKNGYAEVPDFWNIKISHYHVKLWDWYARTDIKSKAQAGYALSFNAAYRAAKRWLLELK